MVPSIQLEQPTRARSLVLRAILLFDYSRKPAPPPKKENDPQEICLPALAQSKVPFKGSKSKSLTLSIYRERSRSALRGGLRGLRREPSVSKGLGLGIHRESSVRQILGFSTTIARIEEDREGDVLFDFPRRPRTKKQRQRGDRDLGGSLKIVYDEETQKHNLVPDEQLVLSPARQSRKASIFHRRPSCDGMELLRASASSTSVAFDAGVSPVTDMSKKPWAPMRTSSDGDGILGRMQRELKQATLQGSEELSSNGKEAPSRRRPLWRSKSSESFLGCDTRAASNGNESQDRNRRRRPRKTGSCDRSLQRVGGAVMTLTEFKKEQSQRILHTEMKRIQSQRRINLVDKKKVHPIVGNKALNNEFKRTQSQRSMDIVDKKKDHPILANKMMSFRASTHPTNLSVDYMSDISDFHRSEFEDDESDFDLPSTIFVKIKAVTGKTLPKEMQEEVPEVESLVEMVEEAVSKAPTPFHIAIESPTPVTSLVCKRAALAPALSSSTDTTTSLSQTQGSRAEKAPRRRGGRIQALIDMLGIH